MIIDKHLIYDLNMVLVSGDLALYVKVCNGKTIRITVFYEENSSNGETTKFIRETDIRINYFDTKASVYGLLEFFESLIEFVRTEAFKRSQHYYIVHLT